MIDRRSLLIGSAGAALLALAPLQAAQISRIRRTRFNAQMRALERASGGRIGMSLVDTGTGVRLAWRSAERFPMCSTFKLVLAAATLARVDRGEERLHRTVPVRAEDRVPTSPVLIPLIDGTASIARMCEATLTTSDNMAANLLMRALGGPSALTAWLRGTGDAVTRVDRWEPEMNRFAPGDPRDTTTPDAMAATVRRILVDSVLRPDSRALLARWTEASRTGGNRIRAALPQGWRAVEKTGTSGEGSFNDIGLILPPRGAPLAVALYSTGITLPYRDGERVLERMTRIGLAALG